MYGRSSTKVASRRQQAFFDFCARYFLIERRRDAKICSQQFQYREQGHGLGLPDDLRAPLQNLDIALATPLAELIT